MMRKLSKDSQQYKMFVDYWQFVQEFYEPEESDAYWCRMVGAADEFYKKYKCDYACDLVMAYVKRCEAVWEKKYNRSIKDGTKKHDAGQKDIYHAGETN